MDYRKHRLDRLARALLLVPVLVAGGCLADPATGDGDASRLALEVAELTAAPVRATLGPVGLRVDGAARVSDVDGAARLRLPVRFDQGVRAVVASVEGLSSAEVEARRAGTRRVAIDVTGDDAVAAVLGGAPVIVRFVSSVPATRGHVLSARIVATAALLESASSPEVEVSAALQPVAMVNADPARFTLAFEGDIAAPDAVRAAVDAGAAPAPEVEAWFGGRFVLRWDAPALVAAAIAAEPLRIALSAASGPSFEWEGRLGARVRSLELTARNPERAWPAPACELEVLACLEGSTPLSGSTDACGEYRATSPCLSEGLCSFFDPPVVALRPVEAPAVESAAQAFDAGCGRGGSWCHLDLVETYEVAACTGASIEDLVELALASTREELRGVTLAGPEELGLSLFFGTGYSPAGPALLDAIHAWAGRSDAHAWIGVDEIPCHNCTDFVDRTIVVYPEVTAGDGVAAPRVVVLSGGHGYDS